MQKLKYELDEKEVDFLIQSLDQLQVKGVQAANFLLLTVNKLQNPINKKEYDAAKAAEISKQITGNEAGTKQVVMPDMIKKMNDLKKPK